ncbi:myb-like DNA-binding protein bas1, partial [Coemansia sp. RSA 2599]
RHMWLPGEDARLQELVSKHGRRWTRIAKEMDLGIHSLSYRSRWQRLVRTKTTPWSSAEDEQLRAAVEDVRKTRGTDVGSRGFWPVVALKIKHTGSTSQDCSLRWQYLHDTRINKKKWSREECGRLQAALDMVSCVSDPPASVACARHTEPWLLLPTTSSISVIRGFWQEIARSVATRSPKQCILKHHFCKQQKLGEPMAVEDVKQLARLVEKHGKRWTFFRRRFFPGFKDAELLRIYHEWQRVGDWYGVDLHTIDPLAMLPDYAGGSEALRPTGIDGRYSPHGALARVSVRDYGPMAPFKLALQIVGVVPRRDKDRGSAPFVAKASNESASLQWMAPHKIDEVVAAIGKHGDGDMEAVSREVQLPLE